MMNSITLFKDTVALPSSLKYHNPLLCHSSFCSSIHFLSSCHLCFFVYPSASEYSVSVLYPPPPPSSFLSSFPPTLSVPYSFSLSFPESPSHFLSVCVCVSPSSADHSIRLRCAFQNVMLC